MIIDCDSCTARPRACGDCVVSALTATPGLPADLDADEQQAIDVLAAYGLVRPLRLRRVV